MARNRSEWRRLAALLAGSLALLTLLAPASGEKP